MVVSAFVKFFLGLIHVRYKRWKKKNIHTVLFLWIPPVSLYLEIKATSVSNLFSFIAFTSLAFISESQTATGGIQRNTPYTNLLIHADEWGARTSTVLFGGYHKQPKS